MASAAFSSLATANPSILGFEDDTLWSSTSNTDTNSSDAVQGAQSLAVNGPGWQFIESVPFGPLESVDEEVLVDIKLPTQQPNQWWYGQVQLYIDAPSVGLYNVYIAAAELSGLPVDEYVTLSFMLPGYVQTALEGDYDDLIVRLALNVPYDAYGTYLFDDLEFGEVQSDPCAGAIVFPDPGLEAAVRVAANLPTGDIYQEDLMIVTALGAQDIGISDLEGIQCLTALNELWLDQNEISDISLLATLPGLEQLGLSDNDISDISTLASLVNLTRLQLWTNNITDLSPLAGLSELSVLGLDDNPFSDTTPLEGLTNLVFLSIGWTNVSDITFLAGLPALSYLSVSACIGLTDLSPLTSLTNLIELSAYYNEFEDLSPLTGLVNLEYLDLHGNFITNIYPLVANTGIDDGDFVNITDNDFSCTDEMILQQISILEGRGVDLLHDCTL